MSNQNRGFDPLSSLFEAPTAEDEFLFDDEYEDDELDHTDGHIDITDPIFAPPPGMPAMPTEEIMINVHTEEQPRPAAVSPEEQARIARGLAAEAMVKAAPEP
ncbi:MAG: hypothetical protein ACI8S6_005510, partial [Myxococcota bacterium]